MKISVYGASGFIGSNYKSLSKNEVDPVSRNLPVPAFDNILYFIGTTDNYNIFSNPTLDIEVNLKLLMENLEGIRQKFGSFSFNFISSWFVYGDGQIPPFREEDNCKPKGFYSISKYAAELFVMSYCSTYEIPYRIIRLGNVFGVNDKGISKKKNALQYLIHRLKENQCIELYEGGEFFRDYIDVRDIVRAIDLILDSNLINLVINVGSGLPIKFIDVILEAKEIFNSTSKIEYIDTPAFHKTVQVKDAWLDISKLQSLGFEIKYPLLKEIVNL